jgi:hypothetical protein
LAKSLYLESSICLVKRCIGSYYLSLPFPSAQEIILIELKTLKKAVIPLRNSEALIGIIFISNLKLSLNKLSLIAICVSLVLTVIMLIKDRGIRRELL